MLNHCLSSEMAIHARPKEDDDHSSLFETSHVLGALVASSPLLMQSWSICGRANASGGVSGFTVEEQDGVVYVAFSAAAAATAEVVDAGFFCLIPIEDSRGSELFPSLTGENGDEVDDNDGAARPPPVLLQAGPVRLFLGLYQSPEFQLLRSAIKGKSVIFTGHSIGGSLASLAALHFLSSSSSSSSPRPAAPAAAAPSSLLCITFGAPLLGNEGLSRAVVRERWAGNFCHVVAQLDVVPRLLFCPLNHSSAQLATLLLSRRSSPQHFSCEKQQQQQKGELFCFIAMHLGAAAAAVEQKLILSSSQQMLEIAVSPYMPFGSYVMCSRAAVGAVCVDDALVVVRMLYSTFAAAAAARSEAGLSIEEEHHSYGDVVIKVLQNLLVKKRFERGEEGLSSSNYSAGVSLALEASGIPIKDTAGTEALECLERSKTKRTCRHPNLRGASLAVRLAKVTPCRAQIEWYKALCDGEGAGAMGYYDCFKLRQSPKRDGKVNMNRIKLAQFWNDVIAMLQSNELPRDFHRRSKWVNAAHFYKLLVEPLDIADYYRHRLHKRKGHYLAHGRPRRYEVFDRWWAEAGEEEDKEEDDPCSAGGGGRRKRRRRSKFAGLTQDSCFWARVEEAMDWLEKAKEGATGPEEAAELWKKLRGFEGYAKGLIERKEVSKDVLAPCSSYSVWAERWKELQLKHTLKILPK